MKKNYIITLLALILLTSISAQESQKNFINYQGVARDAENTLMEQENLEIGISLRFGSANSTAAYTENHTVVTDANGVFSLKIGNGSNISGDYNNLPWGTGATFVTVSINGNEIGTTEMMAVPYAITSGDGDNQSAAEVPYNNTGSGLTATTTQDAIDELSTGGTVDADGDPSNEFQTLNFDAGTNELSLSDGNTVTIPSGGADADADPTNEIQTISFDAASNKISLTDGGEITIPSGGTDADADPTNELQDIALAGTELTISDGSTIDLAPIVPPGGTDNQELTFNETTKILEIEDGNTVDLSSLSGGGGSSLWENDANGINYSLGNIGIGRGSSTFPLDILTNSDRPINLSSSNMDNFIAFNNVGGFKGYVGIFSGDEDMDFGTGFLNTTGKVHLVTGSFPKLTVAANGHVGIGTQTPDANLEVAGAGTVRNRMTSTDAGTVALQWLREGAANTDWMITAGSSGMSIAHSSSDFSGSLVHTRLTEDGILRVGGGLRAANLEGAGERNVVADADGNLIVESSAGNSSRKSNYFQSGTLKDKVDAGTSYTPIGPAMNITKEYVDSYIEVTVSSSASMYVPQRPPRNPGADFKWATKFQVRIDGRVADFGGDGILEWGNNVDFLSIFNIFEDLSVGNHTIQIYVRFLWVEGVAVEVFLDKDSLGGKIIAKETF